MSDGQLSKRIVFGILEGAKWRRWGGQDKESDDRVHSNVNAFDTADDWTATALEAGLWDETITEREQRFMAEWRK